METLFLVRSPVTIGQISPSAPPSRFFTGLRFPYKSSTRRGSFLLRRSPPRSAELYVSSSPNRPQESDSVDVIGIGSRKDAVIDFCLESPFAASSRLRFWTVHLRDSLKVQLRQRSLEKDMVLQNLEFPIMLHPCPPAIILVASAGHDRDHITAIEFLDAVKSAGGLAVAILLRPFSFEGHRRQLEVDDLVDKLQESSQFYIVVETDALLKSDMETLAEALNSANNAALLAMNSISVLTSETHLKLLATPHEQMEEVRASEILKLLESYGETKVGFGAGYNIKSSIIQAVLHCPFLSGGVKGANGIVIFTLSRSCVMEKNDLPAVIRTFRQITGFTGKIIFSMVCEPDLEPNLIVTTLLVLGCNEEKVIHKKSFLSGLALRFPFLSSILPRGHSEQSDLSTLSPGNPSEDVCISTDSEKMPSLINNAIENVDLYPVLEKESESYSKILTNRKSAIGSSKVANVSVSTDDHRTNEDTDFQREQLSSWNVGPGFHVAQVWAKERAALSGTMLKIDKLNVFTLPVGVKPLECYSDVSQISDPTDPVTLDAMSGEFLGNPTFYSRGTLTTAGFEEAVDISNSALPHLRGNVDVSRKQGPLSARASSMLEAERESKKKWTPIMEMQYRGGTYKGRCQGGLPEGKGRLILADGNFYDGMWRCGKRSGLGTFCYSNGDVFQGAWRDDLMHGKGWFYFHTGDRWFANFWKGKANGEGRFYSKSSSVFFGHFRDGWRHGQGLHVDADGLRWSETWEDGVLVRRTKMEP